MFSIRKKCAVIHTDNDVQYIEKLLAILNRNIKMLRRKEVKLVKIQRETS